MTEAAMRSKLYRERRKAGEVVVQVEVSVPAIAGLVKCGLLDQDDVTRNAIVLALGILLDGISKGAIDFDENWIASFGD